MPNNKASIGRGKRRDRNCPKPDNQASTNADSGPTGPPPPPPGRQLPEPEDG